MIRRIAGILLLLAVGYLIWVIALNLPGNDNPPVPASRQVAGPIASRPATEAPSPLPGQLVIPVAGVRADQLVDTYDDARGQGRVHDAIDIMAPRGTPVLDSLYELSPRQ